MPLILPPFRTVRITVRLARRLVVAGVLALGCLAAFDASAAEPPTKAHTATSSPEHCKASH